MIFLRKVKVSDSLLNFSDLIFLFLLELNFSLFFPVSLRHLSATLSLEGLLVESLGERRSKDLSLDKIQTFFFRFIFTFWLKAIVCCILEILAKIINVKNLYFLVFL